MRLTVSEFAKLHKVGRMAIYKTIKDKRIKTKVLVGKITIDSKQEYHPVRGRCKK